MKYSVLMSVYYKEHAEYLNSAMNSIWDQSVKTDDFVLVCDGSLTESLDNVISEMQSSHVELNVIRLEKNNGLGQALNIGLKACKNEIVARMDSDDYSSPDRCEKQLEVFAENKEIDICSGTIAEFKDEISNITGKRELPQTDKDIKLYSRKRNPFNHPAVMFRKSAVIEAGGYDETFHLFEDYYLWVRMLMNGAKGYNITETILNMRTSDDLYMRRGGVLLCYRFTSISQMDDESALVIQNGLHYWSAPTCGDLCFAQCYKKESISSSSRVIENGSQDKQFYCEEVA